MTIQMRPSVQYRDFRGLAEADGADFERLEEILGIEDWIPLGVELYCGHPMLGNAPRATFSYTTLRLWAIEKSRIGDSYPLPRLLSDERPVQVTEFYFESRADYPVTSDGIGILLRGSKRFSMILWREMVHEAGLAEDAFKVVGKRLFTWEDGAWQEHQESD